jgi:plastocyanin
MGSTGSMGSMGSMDSMGSPSGTGGAHTGTATVTIKDFAFHGPASVAPGSSVTVRNDDSETHSLTADGAGGFDVTIGPGTTAMFTAPTKSGSYPYHCMFHGTMHGTLTVR